jgi:hypothetical protein
MHRRDMALPIDGGSRERKDTTHRGKSKNDNDYRDEVTANPAHTDLIDVPDDGHHPPQG